MSAGVVHLVSTNRFHSITMKKTIPPFFCSNVSIKKKCTIDYLSCNARNADFPGNGSLSSKNGSLNSTGTNAKPTNKDQEMVQLFKTYSSRMKDELVNQNGDNNRAFGIRPPIEKQDKGERETFATLLKILKQYGSEAKKSTNSVPSNEEHGTKNEVTKSFRDEDAGTEIENLVGGEEEDGTEMDLGKLFVDGGNNGTEEDDLPVTNSHKSSVPKANFERINPSNTPAKKKKTSKKDKLDDVDSDTEYSLEENMDLGGTKIKEDDVTVTNSRPPSKFSRKSPVPVVASNTPAKKRKTSKKDESESESESIFYEPVTLDDEFDAVESDTELSLEKDVDLSGTETSLEEKSVDLGSLKVDELRAIAKSRGLKGYSKMKKSVLIETLSSS